MIYDAADYFKGEMNQYLTANDKGFYPDVSQGTMWFILTGNVFRKAYVDEMTGLPKSRYLNKLIVLNRNQR